MVIDLTVAPSNPLYEGLGVTEVGGRCNLPNATDAEVLNRIGSAIRQIVQACPAEQRGEVILTGPAPVQIYLVAFHATVHAFKVVLYKDGRGDTCCVAQHG